MSNKDIEVLSPVGSFEMLEAAVRSGADAVYMGLKDFNARRNADNFNVNDLEEAVKYCHIRGVKVYLTLNTLVSDSEISAAFYAAKKAYELGVDAVIVQDIGLAQLLHQSLPQLPLHASTQMSAHSPSALPFLKELGFTRVVASREMSKKELADFTKAAQALGLETEVFVHGALCMCMSGQCYLSAMLGGRSGNRGLCAGPCRLPFAVQNGNGYDLSLKDLSLVDYIDELKKMGVCSLKIEGRMKRPEYVAAATAVCRKTVDGENCAELKDTLYKVFSRSGFTSGYYDSRLGPDMFGIRTKDDVTLSAGVIKGLHELYRNERQSVHIKGGFCMNAADEEIRLTVSDGINSVTVTGDKAQKAINRAVGEDYLKTQLSKTGGTPYIFDGINFSLADGLAISAGALNALRREALTKLSELRYTKNTSQNEPKLTAESHTKSSRKLIAEFYDVSQMPDDLSGLDGVILPLNTDFSALDLKLPIFASVPRGIQNEEIILAKLKKAKEQGIRAAFCGNIAAVTLCNEAGVTPVFHYSMNVFNSQSAACAKQYSAGAVTLSAELKTDAINKIEAPLPTGIIAYGRLPLMLTRNCPLKNGRTCDECDKKGFITDRMGIDFPIRCNMGYSELLNSKPIYLAERLDEFSVDYMVLMFTTEDKDECKNIIEKYNTGKRPDCDYTRGLYYRGVE